MLLRSTQTLSPLLPHLLFAQPGFKSTFDMKLPSFHVTNSIPLDLFVYLFVFKICYLSEPAGFLRSQLSPAQAHHLRLWAQRA